MAKRRKNSTDEEDRLQVSKQYKEADLILLFGLNRVVKHTSTLLQEWMNVETPILNDVELFIFEKKLEEAQTNIIGWSEEDLKMKFIAYIIDLGNLTAGGNIVTYFDKIISATIEGTKLTVKSDFMMAKGLLNVFQNPYFHFQEYKPQINPTGEPMAQLLQAFLIAQVRNNNGKPLYGVEVIGAIWRFVVMENKNYYISNVHDCTSREGLLKIIAVLRKFREILETRLIID